MKKLFPSLTKLLAVAAASLALGSCSRADYAMLPKGASYHGVTRAATPVPTTAAVVAVEAPVTKAATEAPATQATVPAVVPGTAKAPVAKVEASAAVVAVGKAPTATPKLNFVQRLAVAKISKKLEKATQLTKYTRHNNTAATQRLDGKLRQGLILLLVGLLVGIVGGAVGGTIGSVIGLLGLILAIIGIVLIILYLLDEL